MKKFEMPRSYTDHPLSRKVEQPKLYMINVDLQRCYWQVLVLSEDESLRDAEVQLM